MRRPKRAASVLAATLSVCGLHAVAQEELTLPPRITEEPPIPSSAVANDDDSPVAEATPAATEIEEIVVISDQNPWRLPDLGSTWRAEQDEEPTTGRIRAELFPLWNPETEEVPTRNPFAVTDDFSRVGFIELFRVRFGGR